jgi:hypothetical protein
MSCKGYTPNETEKKFSPLLMGVREDAVEEMNSLVKTLSPTEKDNVIRCQYQPKCNRLFRELNEYKIIGDRIAYQETLNELKQVLNVNLDLKEPINGMLKTQFIDHINQYNHTIEQSDWNGMRVGGKKRLSRRRPSKKQRKTRRNKRGSKK